MFEIRSCWRTLRCSALGRRHRRCQPRAPAAGVRRRACISPERFVVAIPGVATTAVATGTGQAAAAGVTAGGLSDHNHHPRRNSTCHSPRWRHNRRHYRRCHNNRRYSKCRGGSRGVTSGSRVQPSALGAGQRPRRRWGHMGRTHERRHQSPRRPTRHPPAGPRRGSRYPRQFRQPLWWSVLGPQVGPGHRSSRPIPPARGEASRGPPLSWPYRKPEMRRRRH